ncbi:keratinocyte proline-rich protein-like [Thrips palmi]|uniref:Keratinocyte proline-rich protein-like n=1 Tax=Thrips palmi TaxID=161013 RepID=A0A6P8ZJY6_THRPL|nr:keratinocyte proline-rich protein-like [Thrips palmi]
MKTGSILKALAVSALVLAFVSAALASCGCSNGGKDVCGLGTGCSKAVVRPARIIPVPRPTTVVRKYVTVVEEESQPTYVHRPAPRPAPQPCYEAAPAPEPAPEPCYSCGRGHSGYSSCGQEERTVVYKPAPLPVQRIVVRPAPQPVCRSCLLPAPSCGCQ